MRPVRSREVLVREALRLHRRYQEEVIERFSICPWARSARLEGRVRAHVLTEEAPEPHATSAIVDAWAADDTVEVAFVIVPLFAGGIEAFGEWARDVASLRSDVFFGAPFFPEADRDAGAIHFLRRAPDPTVQLVRRARLEAIRAHDPPHYRDIFEIDLGELDAGQAPRTVAASVLAHNERLLAERIAEIEAILGDIHEDRAAAYGG